MSKKQRKNCIIEQKSKLISDVNESVFVMIQKGSKSGQEIERNYLVWCEAGMLLLLTCRFLQ